MNFYLEKVVSLANQNKYTKYYSHIIENALKRPQDRKFLKGIFGYVESHHILPESFGLGGEKDKENLVFLTAKEHFIQVSGRSISKIFCKQRGEDRRNPCSSS